MYIYIWPHFFHCLWTDLNGSPRMRDEVEIRQFHVYRHKNTVTVVLWKLSLRNARHSLVSLRSLSDIGEICVSFGLSFIQI